MTFEKFTGRNSRSDLGDPTLTVSSSKGEQIRGYISAAAVRRWLENAHKVLLHVDPEASKLGIERTNKQDEDGYALQKKGGASIALDAVLGSFGLSARELDGTWKLDLEKDGALIVADVSTIVEDVTGDVHCPECGKRCATDQGLKTHISGTHDDPKKILEAMDPDEIGGGAPEGDDSWKEMYQVAEGAHE